MPEWMNHRNNRIMGLYTR